MFSTLLIANRGEIACRIIRTARRLGIRTVAIYSDADRAALHVRQADVALRVGPAPAVESYLDVAAVLRAAQAGGAEAIHPGYGFLAENAAFAEACADAGIAFVGPAASAIRAMGSKIEAKRLVAEAGAPVVPGYQGDDQADGTLAAEAERIGFPLLIKASAGGGGKGMRRVDAMDEFAAALAGARREAQSAFGDERMLLERYLRSPKHLEVQILADAAGNTLHLFERDCSVQRRHQKVIEEAPGPSVGEALRAALGEAAVRAARAVDYQGAGTVEFITEAAGARADAVPFYFMEMNTRLQVEHPVTEAVTGLDLVEWQLRIAAGESVPFRQEDLRCLGHAVEARVYAENPRRNFLPSTGRLTRLRFPDHVRVDSGVTGGDAVGVHYDPMLAKIIAHGRDRAEAVGRLDAALADTEIAGVEHNIAFLRAVLAEPAFRAGGYTTHLIDDAGDRLLPARDDAGWVCAALVLRGAARAAGSWGAADGFRLNEPSAFGIELEQDGRSRHLALYAEHVRLDGEVLPLADVEVHDDRVGFRLDGGVVRAGVVVDGESVFVVRGGDTERFRVPRLDVAALAHAVGGTEHIASPMPGQVISVAVRPGEKVAAGQVLLVIEAMKMEHGVTAPRDGTVAAVACSVGDRVEDGVELVTLEADPAAA
jgi:3-methylcrotonyl-CoA carboxylase alpha subunit